MAMDINTFHIQMMMSQVASGTVPDGVERSDAGVYSFNDTDGYPVHVILSEDAKSCTECDSLGNPTLDDAGKPYTHAVDPSLVEQLAAIQENMERAETSEPTAARDIPTHTKSAFER